ncbi:tripartite tricarboxylate transporter TctB family protein [Oceanimonas sp. CHS3-5]|uniref:tripartite tricarboxylate transporter TctB family protein n=1 Tax=Oceanimonas sp. CHS3-5 TaxID=3068186 RepID=UPI0027401DC8|nr:tripartite tricarboxylate transporter TctB family protein [Oceanimonas sp. CHS3-5]MDP5292980.1 tripartite tricarboxylate transporter TctB family protein [Oceanimonas sp. CHS3-5]
MLFKNKDFSIGVGVLSLSLLLIYYVVPVAVISPTNVRLLVLDPAFWPNVISWMMLLIGVVMMATSLSKSKEAESSRNHGLVSYKKELPILLLILFFVGYYLLLPDLGMVWGSSISYIFLSVFIYKTKHRLSAVIVGILLPIILYAFFYHVAGVSIPQSEMVRLP